MSALSIIKSSAELIVSVGAGAVVGNAIKASIPVKANRLTRVSLGIGGFVLTGMVGDMAAKYAVQQIEETADNIVKIREAVKQNVKIEVKSVDPDQTDEA